MPRLLLFTGLRPQLTLKLTETCDSH